jgi:hypothetical protein
VESEGEEEDAADTGFSVRLKPLADPSARVFKRALVEVTDGTAAALTVESQLRSAAAEAERRAQRPTAGPPTTQARAPPARAAPAPPAGTSPGGAAAAVTGSGGAASGAAGSAASLATAAGRTQFAVGGASKQASAYAAARARGDPVDTRGVPVWEGGGGGARAAGAGAGAGGGVPRWE